MVSPNLFFSIPPPTTFLKLAIQTTGCLPCLLCFLAAAWLPSPPRGSRSLVCQPLLTGATLRVVTLPPWNATSHPGTSESAKGSPATSWQDLILLNLFSQPVTELCAVWKTGPNASFNSLLLMEILGSGKQSWLWD